MKKVRQPRVVKGMPSVELSRKEFVLRFHQRHVDPTFDVVAKPLDAVAEVAWKNYIEYHKAPLTRKAGSAYADPSYELSRDWIAARARIKDAERSHRRKGANIITASYAALSVAMRGSWMMSRLWML